MTPDLARALIFDCDGTLADTMPAHFRAWAATTARHGLQFSEDRFYTFGGMPSRAIVAQLAKEQGVTLDVIAVAAEKERAFLEQLDAVRAVPPIMAVAERFRGMKPMAVASGGYRNVVTLTLERLSVVDWFPVVVTAEDTKRHKPEPDVFLEAARKLGVAPEFCLVYEDTDIGLEAAARAGMAGFDVRTVYVPPRVT